jgi:hypothetical protein
LANSARAYEDWACEAINDIHNLTDKFNGSVSQKDAEIKNPRNLDKKLKELGRKSIINILFYICDLLRTMKLF